MQTCNKGHPSLPAMFSNTIFFWIDYVLLHFHSFQVPLFLTPRHPHCLFQESSTNEPTSSLTLPLSTSAISPRQRGNLSTTFVMFVPKEPFALVGRDHRKGMIWNNTWLLWRSGRLQRWYFSSNEGRPPGAGVWDRPSLTLACETIKAKEICHCWSTRRCEKREIKLEEDLFYHPCWDWSGGNPTTVCPPKMGASAAIQM